MALDVVNHVLLTDLTEVARAIGADLTQKAADRGQMGNDGPPRQTPFPLQIIAKRLEYLLIRGDRRLHRRSDHARIAQNRQKPVQRRPVASLNKLLAAPVPKVTLSHAFIEAGHLEAAACNPT